MYATKLPVEGETKGLEAPFPIIQLTLQSECRYRLEIHKSSWKIKFKFTKTNKAEIKIMKTRGQKMMKKRM